MRMTKIRNKRKLRDPKLDRLKIVPNIKETRNWMRIIKKSPGRLEFFT